MLAFFSDVQLVLIATTVGLVVGVVFSTKVTDWFKGIPAELRTSLNQVETATVAKVKVATAGVVATLPTVAPPVPKPVTPGVAVVAAPATPPAA
jgi:hypothetical protein